MGSLSSPVLLALFIASAGIIWIAGIKLSDNTDVLAERLHLGSALGGLILLAIATNLPEIAITASAAVAGQLDVAVGNILGGIAIQTVVLVVLDAVGVRPRAPLTRLAASLMLVLEGALVVIVLSARASVGGHHRALGRRAGVAQPCRQGPALEGRRRCAGQPTRTTRALPRQKREGG
jgi:cation:H+ antiporter